MILMRVYIRNVHDKSFHHAYDLTIYSKLTPSKIAAALCKTRLRNLEYKMSTTKRETCSLQMICLMIPALKALHTQEPIPT